MVNLDLYDGPLNSEMDFAAAGPNGEPASGLAVQNYIKSKIGVGYYDDVNFRHLFFADEHAKLAYIADPTREDLILDSVQLESEYSMKATLIDPADGYAAVFYGSTGNYIRYSFETQNKSQQTFPESVDVIYTISHSGTSVAVNESYHAGATVSFNIDKYLLEGTNDILINIKGQLSKASTTIGVRVDAVNLSLSDNFNLTPVYTNQDNLTVSFDYSGVGVKYVEWYLDGDNSGISTDSYISASGSGIKNISLSGLGAGRHNLQYRMYIEVAGGSRFYSNTLYRDFVVNDQTLTNTVILTKFTIPQEVGIIDAFTQPISLNGPTQYEEYIVEYCIYSKTNKSSYSMSVTLGSSESVFDIRNRVQYEYNIRNFSSGTTPLVFSCEGTTLSFNAVIEGSDYDIDPITDTVFEFSGSDRSNSSDDRDEWEFGDYTGVLTGFSWNENSGWSDGKLVIPDEASFVTTYAPFATEVLNTGFTFEIEFETTRVLDETATVLDLTKNGKGLLITTSEISYITASSSTSTTLSTRYKPEENIRISLVINPLFTGAHPKMIFIYVDGILTGAAEYTAADSFVSDAVLQFIGTDSATVRVKQIRCYRRPLTHNEVLNNFIIYRDTVEELVNTYDRNNVYMPGTEIMSADKLAAYTPVIIITCNTEGDDTPDRIAMMQGWNETNKKTYVKMHKIEVINNADPTRNMILINPSMRCQGTSSMAYPRKNFRFYTQADSKDETVPKYTTQMFDWEGNELTGKQRLYSFKTNAQPVKCWCLKADYAESSSTHNTGVARMWNDYLKNIRISNAEIDNRFYLKTKYSEKQNWNTPCKTIAQQCAEDNNYEYDVRTTVDGYPITLFYHVHEGDPLIFLGKYNWNNDKSTESVFGFKDIPGFEPYKNTMECWEVVNGDKTINQFLSMSTWDAGKGNDGWQDSFEARYPDDSGEESEATRAEGALKRVCTWLCSTNGASRVDNDPSSPTYNKMIVNDPVLMTKFKTGDPGAEVGQGRNGKWDFLDVYKVAAYYIYLMRFGAVDQTVKNAMFTTEDGLHWYYINYDNDTINGVRNDGALKFGYLIDRQSKDPDSPLAYCYAGHASVLWNNLEADDEFMGIVRKIDQALFTAGMTYSSVIDMFNNKQSAQWSERTHNEDYDFKYINISDRTQLSKLQGPRKSHRQWWLSHRFATYDAINGTDAYLGNRIEIKPLTAGTPGEGEYVTVTPAVDGQIFGYGYQLPKELGVKGYKDVPIQFDMVEDYYVGTTIKFYNAVYFKEIDVSRISQYVNEIDLTRANSAAFNSELSSFVLGTLTSQSNTSMNSLNGLDNLKYLENFQMIGYNSIGSVDLSGNNYLKTVDVRNCTNLSNIDLPHAAPLETIHLPSSIISLDLDNYAFLDTVDIQGNAANVRNINVVNCPSFTDDPTFLLDWLDNKTTPDEECSVYMDNVNWTLIDIDDLREIGDFKNAGGHLELYGRATLVDIRSEEDAQFFMDTFGANVFEPTASFYISAPPAMYLIGPTSVLEGESAQYRGVLIGTEPDGTFTYQIMSGGTARESIDRDTGLLTTTETGGSTSNLTLRVIYLGRDGSSQIATLPVQVIQRTYPTAAQVVIVGDAELKIGQTNTYTIEYTIEGINGNMSATWSLTGDAATYATIESYGMDGCRVALPNDPGVASFSGGVSLVLTKVVAGTTITPNPKLIGYMNDSIAVSRITNPYAMNVLYGAGLCESPDFMTKVEALLVTSDDLNSGYSYQYTTSIFYTNSNFRTKCTNFDEFKWFTGVSNIKGLFYGCTGLESIIIPSGVTSIGSNSFYNCTKLESIIIPSGVTFIGSGAFQRCTGLTSITFPSSVTSISSGAFQDCTGLTAVTFNCDVPSSALRQSSSSSPFYGCTNINSVTIGSGCTAIGDSAFQGCTWLTSLILPIGVTSIGYGAFQDCTGLTSITIPEGLVTIGNDAFRECTGLTSITIPSSVTSIGSAAFSYCGLTSATLQEGSLTTIGSQAFLECTELTSIYIPSSVTTFGGREFQNCIKLTSVTINRNIPDRFFDPGYSYGPFYGCQIDIINIGADCTSIMLNAFNNCKNLTSITVDSSNTIYNDGDGCNCIIRTSDNVLLVGGKNTAIPSNVSSIGQNAFYGRTGLTTITIPEGVTTIGNYAFYECTGLTTITIPDSMISIGHYAFYGCTGLTTLTISQNSSLTTLNSQCFYGCINLTSFFIPANVTTFSFGAFEGCTGLTSIVVDPNNASYTDGRNNNGHDCVCGKSSLELYFGCKNTVIPDIITSIYDSAFRGCTGLTSITIPPSVTLIRAQAFYGCTGLTSITIPAALTNITNTAFNGCAGLENIVVDSNNNRYNDGNGSKCIIQTSDNSLICGCKNTTIPSNVTSIGQYAFYECTELTSITIPSSVTSIRDRAFYGCTGLATITITDGVISIGQYAFLGCTELTSITIPSSVTSIGQAAFSECVGLTHVTFNCNVPNYALNINSSSSPFYGCVNINSVTIGSECTTIGQNAFANCHNLTSITIPSSVTSIGQSSFYNCWGLTSINIPTSLTLIESQCFYGCTKLTSIEIPDNVTSISAGAFQGCTGLLTAIIGSGVTSISGGVFTGCSKLATITCRATTPPTIQSTSFPPTSVVQHIYVPSTSVSDYQGASNWSTYSSKISAITE